MIAIYLLDHDNFIHSCQPFWTWQTKAQCPPLLLQTKGACQMLCLVIQSGELHLLVARVTDNQIDICSGFPSTSATIWMKFSSLDTCLKNKMLIRWNGPGLCLENRKEGGNGCLTQSVKRVYKLCAFGAAYGLHEIWISKLFPEFGFRWLIYKVH